MNYLNIKPLINISSFCRIHDHFHYGSPNFYILEQPNPRLDRQRKGSGHRQNTMILADLHSVSSVNWTGNPQASGTLE